MRGEGVGDGGGGGVENIAKTSSPLLKFNVFRPISKVLLIINIDTDCGEQNGGRCNEISLREFVIVCSGGK